MWFSPFSIKDFLKELLSEYIGIVCFFILLVGLLCWSVNREVPVEDKKEPMQLGVRIPEHIVSMLDEHVDGIRYRSRAQLITVIVDDWLTKKECLNMTPNTKKFWQGAIRVADKEVLDVIEAELGRNFFGIGTGCLQASDFTMLEAANKLRDTGYSDHADLYELMNERMNSIGYGSDKK